MSCASPGQLDQSGQPAKDLRAGLATLALWQDGV